MKYTTGKLVIVALILALVIAAVMHVGSVVSAATSGPLDAGTGTDNSAVGTVAWTDPGNITTVGAPYASVSLAGGGTVTSHYLQATGYGFSIPADATINGIAVSINRLGGSQSRFIDVGVYLRKVSGTIGTNMADLVNIWPTVMTEKTYGSSTDTWGTSWTPAEINAATFGVCLSVRNSHPNQTRTGSVDYMRITVTYSATVTPTTLTVDSATGTYGSTASVTATLSPAVAGKTISFTLNGSPAGTATTNGSGVANIPAADLTGIDVGIYPTGVGASFAGDSSYGASSGSNSLTVNARDIAVTADNKSKAYGDTDPALTYQITSGALASGDSFTGALTRDPGVNVGSYDITQGSLAIDDGNSGNNYNLTFTKGTLTITKRNVTVTADNKSKTYGDPDPVLTYQITSGSLASGDDFIGTISREGGENVGTYAIGQGSLAISDGNDGNNYNLTFTEGTFTITAEAIDITVTADNKSKTYGDADPALTYQITSGSLLPGDSFSGSITRVPGENVGSYDIEQGTLALGSNYNLTFVKGTFAISTRNITVTADNKGKTYGDADPALTYQITSGALAGDDSFTGTLTRDPGVNVGSYDITRGSLAIDDGNSGNNYNLTFTEGTFTITKRNVTATADNKSKTYGDADPALTYQITSGALASGDSFSGAITRDPGQNVGSYDIHQGTLALSSNYSLTFVDGTFTITKRSVTVTADNKGKTYGDADPALTYQITSGSLAGGDSFTGALTRIAGEDFGTYDILQGTLTLSSNYSLSFVKGTFTISPLTMAITVTANDAGKSYGDADPALTYQITSGSLLPGDSFSGSITRVPGENAGSYDIEQGTLTLGSNYTLTFVKGTFTITARNITVTADDKSKLYGNSDPMLSYQIVAGSLVAGDVLSGAISRMAGENVGTYDIQQGTLVLSSNYNLDFVGGTLTVNPATLTITASNRAKTHGDTVTFAGTEFSATGLMNTDTVTRVALTSAGAAAGAAAGTYSIVPGAATGTGLGNYAISYINGTLSVSKTAIGLELTLSSTATKPGESIIFTAAITGTGATGSVTFKDGDTILGTRNLVNGTATLEVSDFAAGSHSITAVYNGDANFSTSASSPADLTVSRASGGNWGLIGGIIGALLLVLLLLLLSFLWRRRKNEEENKPVRR